MTTRNIIVVSACGLGLLISAFALGFKLAPVSDNAAENTQVSLASSTNSPVPVISENTIDSDVATTSAQQPPREPSDKLKASPTLHLEQHVAALANQVAELTETVARLERETSPQARRPSRQVDEASFIEAGFDPATASSLVKRLNQFSMEEMYLRDQAAREGWLNSQEYREAQEELQKETEALRTELGEDDYDRLLYATGRPNRITVDSVIGDSPADWVGLQSGDRILSYGGERMYEWSDLRQAISDGEAGALVPIQVERDGSVLDLSIERGPLGIRLGVESVKPGVGVEAN